MKKKKHSFYLWFLCLTISKSLKKKFLGTFSGKVKVKKQFVFKRSANGNICKRKERLILARKDSTFDLEEIVNILKSIFKVKGFIVGELAKDQQPQTSKTIFVRKNKMIFRVVVNINPSLSRYKTARIRIRPTRKWPKAY